VRRRGSEGIPDVSWFRLDGSEMSDEDWDSGFGKSVAVYFNGLGIPGTDPRGQRLTDDSFVLCFNAHHEPIEFTLPPEEFGLGWIPVIDSAADTGGVGQNGLLAARTTTTIDARAVLLLQATAEPA
jgi:glycogen operon protein